jgi:small ligand-binding sensory domain FIST
VISAGSAISGEARGDAAVRAAAEEALAAAGLRRADAALLFATASYGSELPTMVEAAVGALGTEVVVGATAHGVMCGGREEEEHGIALLVLGGIEAHPFLVSDLRRQAAAVGTEITQAAGRSPDERDLILLLPDAAGADLAGLIAAVRAAVAPAAVVGAGAAQPLAAPSLQWCGRELATGALAGLVLRGESPPRIGVTQSCQPVSDLMTVTRAEGNWILELDGRPALDVFREVARGPLAADLRRAAAFVLVALPKDAQDPLRPGGYLVRHAVGFAEARRALALPEAVGRGGRVAFVLRDALAAREDMKSMLAGLGNHPPAFGLYLDCCARGVSLFGVPGLEAAYLEGAFAGRPILGMLGSCEIGPIGGTAELLTYTGVLALVDSD